MAGRKRLKLTTSDKQNDTVKNEKNGDKNKEMGTSEARKREVEKTNTASESNDES